MTNKQGYYIGLMSGTSADGIDLTLVTFDDNHKPQCHGSFFQTYTVETVNKITSLYNPDNNEIDRAFELDIELARLFATAIEAFLLQENLTANDIIAIGSHGQTIRHRPQNQFPFTLQIGCCQTLATLTNIRVIGQFRRKDMALGGQGAPLVPAFHEKIFSESSMNNGSDVFVINIGGISNLTLLPVESNSSVIGYDTGTGNALMDDWFKLHNPDSMHFYDKDGHWANQGKANNELLKTLLSDDYFTLAPPKSTGREYFNLSWLERQLAKLQPIAPQDVQATLTAFTALSITKAIQQHLTDKKSLVKIYLCGGGVHNETLINNINQQLSVENIKHKLMITQEKNINGDQLEAIAFAWLAFAYDKKILSSMPAVTGASKSCTLGIAYFP